MPEHASACPLADLCAEAEALALRRRGIEAEGLASEDRAVKRAADRAVDEIGVTLGHIAQRASDFRPASLEGALFALACAAAEAELVETADEPPPGALRRLRRHLWGLRAYLESDGAMPEAVATFYMPRHRDPHAALAATRAREVA
jgi:hypothetical protein